MENIDELKNIWAKAASKEAELKRDDVASMIAAKSKRERNRVMKYFWASFVYQIIVYALLSHVAIRFWYHPALVIPSLLGIAMFIPFTWMLMSKFKQLATLEKYASTIQQHIDSQIRLINEFYNFKKAYEFALVPASAAIGVYVTLQIFLPGEFGDHLQTAAIIYAVTLLSCFFAIRKENRENFAKPLRALRLLADEFKS